ncbi:SIMPL domain-containing protein [Sporosarcina sp. 179-K 3D1 HS]|uniref:SIMPL domain-containing protein n=1 Tax=Sporosarcina sp. 179-K 3D1 HS TaxID=3232169 RepID=UPI0039A2AC05
MYLQQVRCFPNRTLTVTGEGSVTVSPDVAEIRLEVSTENLEVRTAQQENAEIMDRVLDALMRAGIPREQIQTTAYTIFPRYDFVEGEQIFRGYEVNHAIAVTIPDIGRVGEIIDLAVRNGVNRVSNIQFRVGNEELHYQQALGLALQDARSKAQAIGDAMGVQVNPIPKEVIEEQVPQATPFQSMALMEREAATPIEPGQMKITARLNAQFIY